MDKSAAIPPLRPVGVLYGSLMTLRNTLYDRGILKTEQSPIPVVSVGNITVGGTGKTPLVDWIVRFYHSAGIRTAIISRGYGRKTKGVRLVSDGIKLLLGSRDAGDETVMLAARNPTSIVIVAEKRMKGVEFLMAAFNNRLPAVVVLDDAFQHRGIARDLDIVVINSAAPSDLDALLPAGRLREPLAGLGRADMIVLSKLADAGHEPALFERLEETGKALVGLKIRPGMLLPESIAEQKDERSRSAFAFAGIGTPDGFIRTLEEAGIEIAASAFLRDHEPYTRQKLEGIVAEAERMGLMPVTTEKDWYRMQDDPELVQLLVSSRCRYLTIEPALISGRELLEQKLLAALDRPLISGTKKHLDPCQHPTSMS